MLIGEYQNQLDNKNRMIIPSKMRDELGIKCIITKGLDDCLVIFPLSTWEKQEQLLAGLPMSDPLARAYKRFIYQNASDCEMDRQGRLLIPLSLKEKAHMSKDLVTIGLQDRIEVWDRESFMESENGGMLSADSFAGFSDKYQV